MTPWYTPHIVGIQYRSDEGRTSDWRNFPDAVMSIRQAQTAYDDGTHELCQAREPGRNYLIAVKRQKPVVRVRMFGTRSGEGRAA